MNEWSKRTQGLSVTYHTVHRNGVENTKVLIQICLKAVLSNQEWRAHEVLKIIELVSLTREIEYHKIAKEYPAKSLEIFCEDNLSYKWPSK